FAFTDYQPKLIASPEIARGVRTFELGPPRLPTFDRVALHLDSDTEWRCARNTANQIFIAIEGTGVSTIGERELAWAPGDVLAAPSWLPQAHRAHSDAILMRMSDAPVMQAFQWLRTGG
ncbi:MAG: cupin domain-containing protein, partial [Pseudomonadota bacterium]|nr:cupin domain-containing protein [Pseudomonadota bacterium]